jgi:hypothetical protein
MKNTKPTPGEALRKAHRALFKDMANLEAATRDADATDGRVWRHELEQARSLLTRHFLLEEQDGYMANVLAREPRLEHAVDQLLKEHHQLLASLDTLLDAVRLMPAVKEGFRSEVRAWINGVKAHESRENGLVEDAFNLDTGAED